MKNLIEKSFEIDPSSYFVNSNGERIDRYRNICVEIKTDDGVVFYNIYRGSVVAESVGHISSRRVNKLGYEGKSIWKMYENKDKFESAIKRIEKMISK